jgi:predicted deacetylase
MSNNRKDLTQIVENVGFQNVAYAIRHATVIPQSRKARGQDALYEVRYGLGAELKRKSAVRDEFVVALTDFIQSYNQENAQKLESTNRQLRRDIRTNDIAEVVRLIDEYGAELVANLLIAFGYARESREEQEEQPAA